MFVQTKMPILDVTMSEELYQRVINRLLVGLAFRLAGEAVPGSAVEVYTRDSSLFVTDGGEAPSGAQRWKVKEDYAQAAFNWAQLSEEL